MKIKFNLMMAASLICLLGIALGFACKIWYPELWTDGYIVVIVFFYIVEMMVAMLMSKYEGKMSQNTLEGKTFMKKFMMMKMGKMISTLVMVGVYIVMMKNSPSGHPKEFAVCAVFFYLLNLAVETYIVNKQIKSEQA
ncbi:MAG: hypothetical protein MJZ36_06255 [Bacteroidaceae bacterium]|nr:hypothetical protein [Bacteroidaceae bacterium]